MRFGKKNFSGLMLLGNFSALIIFESEVFDHLPQQHRGIFRLSHSADIDGHTVFVALNAGNGSDLLYVRARELPCSKKALMGLPETLLECRVHLFQLWDHLVAEKIPL